MAKITLEEQPEYSVLPVDSIVTLTVKEVAVKEVTTNGRPWDKLEITFNIDGIQVVGDGTPVQNYQSAVGSVIWGSVPFRLTDSAENKLRLWAEAILGMELGLGFELDTDYFVGRKVRGLIGNYDKKSVNPATGKPFKAHQVVSLLKADSSAPAATPTVGPSTYQIPQTVTAGGAAWQAEEPPF